MEKVKNRGSFAIKIVCYTLIPILFISLVLSITSVVFFVSNNLDTSIKNYFQTEQFAETYKTSIQDNTYISMNYNAQTQYYLYSELQIDGNTNNTQTQHYSYNQLDINTNEGIKKVYYNITTNNRNFKYLVIDKTKNLAFTNLELTMKTDTIQEIKQEISKNQYYWNYYNNNVDTNIEQVKLENIRYTYLYENIEKQYNCEIYTSIDSNLGYIDQYYTESIIYNVAIKQYENAYINIPLCIILIIICVILVTIFSGRKKGEEGVYLNGFDKIPLEIAIIIGIIITLIPFAIIVENSDIITTSILFPIIYIGLIVCYDTLVKRLKSHTLLKNTLIYKICVWILKIGKDITHNIDIAIKLAFAMALFIIFNFVAGFSVLRYNALIGLMLLVTIWIYTYIWIYKQIKSFLQINYAIKQIYEGNTNISLEPEMYNGLLKQLCIYINDISGGLSNAIEQGVKSEKMKAELITNVSHDIKTPLTSIINYVDLLKKEQMPNDKAKQYLEILEQKSQRLKRLTEDLVEASKASSGNIKLNIERINIKELINQISGEFGDRLKEKKLELIIDMPQEEIYIQADGRYLHRVIENMYSNIEKYALENSRVYIDVVLVNENYVEIRLKNISKEKLNISTEELMQRFVRGDTSRNTEGSGLGLSIAQSLTTLQNGEFNIYLDGDLFKVVIKFKRDI